MLGCPCKMIKPFTFATSKKGSVFRNNSVVKMPLACYCTKSVFLHVVKNRQFSRREWDTGKSFFREQKSFIWTSLILWKNKEGKIASQKEELKLPENIEKKTSLENIRANILTKNPQNELIQSNTSPENIIKTAIDVKYNQISGSPAKDSIEDIIRNDLTTEKLKKDNLDEFYKSKFIPPKTTDLKTDKQNEVSKDVTQDDKSEVRRQMYEINLGKVTKTELSESPDINTETVRTADKITTLKETPQKFFEKAKNLLMKTQTVKNEEERSSEFIDLGPAKGNLEIRSTTRRRQTVDLNRCSTERNFITPVRAMTDFLLKPSDLEGLRKTKRRSPYENDPPITVYWRKDVEAKALDVWGSKENLLKEILKRDIERRRYQQNLFTVKRRLRDYRREQGRESEIKTEQNGLFGSSGKVVLTAVAINGINFMFKLTAWLYTGSHSMFSETIHSLADTINQLILAYGIHKSVQKADSDHPYGYTNMRYVASLISGVGIFCVGSGLSFYHGVMGLTDPADLPSFYWAYFILLGSLASEGATLLVAFNSIRLGARKSDMSLSEYVFRGQDPSVNVVLLEDAAAVIGVAFAGSCMGLSSYYDSHVPDAIGSFLVGGLLACVASFIIYTNVAALVGRSISQERLDKINAELESDVMIRAIHDVKGIDIGNSLVRYKAEMDFDGGELTRSYLDKQDLNQMLEEVRKMQTIDELEEFMLKHGENIVDMMGGEIDRIELKLRKKHPEIRHCDLEIL